MAPNFKNFFEKSPNFAKYLIFGPKTDKKTHFGAIWNFSHLCINPLWTIGHICHTIFGPIRMCGYLNIAPERLKVWKKSAATFCSSWNCASNELNYRSIAIVVPKIFAVKVLRRLSSKTRKSQNLIVFKGLTWPQISKKISKNHQISPNISFLAQKLTKKHILEQFEIFHTSMLTLCER